MKMDILEEVRQVIRNSVAPNVKIEELTDQFQLTGNVLDSMAVTNLILALEEHFDITFEDEELTGEAFETVSSLTNLVQNKVNN